MRERERERGEEGRRGGKEGTNLPLLGELWVHEARTREQGGETIEERERGRE